MVRRFASLVALVAATSLPSVASADEPEWTPPVITPIVKGTPAPYTGVLLTPEAVAKIVAEAKDCPKRVQVEADKAAGRLPEEDAKKSDDDLKAEYRKIAERRVRLGILLPVFLKRAIPLRILWSKK
jgi:hypothetical protein